MTKTRIAPSPTGDPHIGTAYTALFNYAFAKKNKGEFLLRVEDTDRTRFVEGATEKIIDSLKWLGINPDKKAIHQSDRLEHYKKAAKELVDKGAAYICNCSPERLEALRKEQQEKGQVPRYDKKCLNDPPKVDGPFVIRLKVNPEGETTFEDLVRGKITFPNKDIDDSVLLKSDGWPTYHLAVVVDDHDMGITHVVRAEEWLSSTPKHVILYEAFGYNLPVFAHLPLLRNPDRSKISKRKNPVSLEWYRDQGFLPEALLNYLATMGWSMPGDKEIFSLEEFIEAFTFDRVDPAGPVFDIVKLTWMNGEYIRKMDDEGLLKRLKEYSKYSPEEIKKVLPLLKERMKKLSEFDFLASYFFEEIKLEKQFILQGEKDANETKRAMEEVEKVIDKIKDWDKKEIEKSIKEFQEGIGWSNKELFTTLRNILTGSSATPPIFETIEALGKEKVLKRLKDVQKLLA